MIIQFIKNCWIDWNNPKFLKEFDEFVKFEAAWSL